MANHNIYRPGKAPKNTRYYLYVKESPLGLKYLGVTTSNPFTYRGSGLYWARHRRLHKLSASTIKTTVLADTFDLLELQRQAVHYSELYGIVASDEWANLMPETGCIGFIGYERTPEQNKRRSERMRNRTQEEKDRGRLAIQAAERRHCKTVEFSEVCKRAYRSIPEEKKADMARRRSERMKGKAKSPEHRAKLARSKTRSVKQFTKEGDLLREWGSVKEAADSVSGQPDAMKYATKVRQGRYKGYVWVISPKLRGKAT